MRRRSVLASTTALLASGLTGCLDRSNPAPDERNETPPETSTTPSGTPSSDPTTAAPDVSLSVEVDRLQPGVVLLGIDSIGVAGDENQYLYLQVDVTDGEPPGRSAFRFWFDGRSHAPGVDTSGQLWRERADDRYTAERGSGWLLFELPESGDASDVALTLGDEEWPVADDVRTRIAEPEPKLSLEWQVPEEPTPGETSIGFSVRNEGERDTRFVAGLNESGIRTAYSPIEAFHRQIPAGETVSWEVTHDNGMTADSEGVDDGETDGKYVLSWTGGRLERDVRFVSEEE